MKTETEGEKKRGKEEKDEEWKEAEMEKEQIDQGTLKSWAEGGRRSAGLTLGTGHDTWGTWCPTRHWRTCAKVLQHKTTHTCVTRYGRGWKREGREGK